MIVGLRTAIRRLRTTGPRRRLRVWGALAVVLGVGLGWVPLFGVLGFELATAVALFAAVMGLDLGSALARERQRRGGDGERAGGRMVRSTVAAAGLAVFLPVIVCCGFGIILAVMIPALLHSGGS